MFENAAPLFVGAITAGLLVLIGCWIGRIRRIETERTEDYRTEAHTDSLTGLANRRALDKQLDAMFQMHRDGGGAFVLALIDIDFFKRVNDSHGHPAGDVALERIAVILTAACRDASMVARYGGDEFAILSTDSLQVAADRMDRLRLQIARQPIEVGGRSIAITISVGLSESCCDETVDQVIGRADESLYLAKKGGRNRVCSDDALTKSAFIRHTVGNLCPKFENDAHLDMSPPRPHPILTCHLDELETDPGVLQRVKQGAVSIGNFDGVHVGHRELLASVRRAADRVDGPAVVVVLDPHPATVLRPHSAPARLTTIARRAALMSELGIDVLVVCPATLEFLNRTADDFFELLISDRLQAKTVVEGPNFFFGRDRGGDINRLRLLCEQTGKSLEIVEPRIEDERMVSSSRIREAISAGEILSANAMLQSTYQVTGRVAAGAGRGRTLGFPTANLVNIPTLIPGHGVYAAQVSGEGLDAQANNARPLLAAVHVGPNPTFDEEQRTKVEVHCLDYDGDLYGESLTVHWLDQIRGVEKFADADALALQIKRDIAAVRDLAANRSFR